MEEDTEERIEAVHCLKRAPLTLAEIMLHVSKPIRQASRDIGLGVTQLKNACRRLGTLISVVKRDPSFE